MVEFVEKFDDKDVVKIGINCDGNSEVRKRYRGVSKSGMKWRARIQHPKEKFEIHLGYYSSPEEAALVVKKKKAEYEEMFKGNNSMNMETCRDYFEGRKLPSGVVRKGISRWGARIRHPKLKRDISLGSYNTPEKAALAVDTKRAEFLEMYGWKRKVNLKPSCKESDTVLEEPEVVGTSDLSDELTGDVTVPAGLTPTKSGKWGARIRGPVARSRIWLGTFDTVKEAFRSINKGKAELAAKRERTEFEGPMKLTSALGADNLNSLSADKSNYEVREVDVSDKQEHKSAHRSSISVIERENSNRADVEYKEMFKGFNSMNMETCRDDFVARKLPSGVWRSGYRRWGTRIHHPMLRRKVSLGSYSTPEETAVVQNKRAEFLKIYGWRGKVNLKPDGKDNAKFLEKPEPEIVTTFKISDELTRDVKLPAGVRKTESGKWGARVRDPVTRSKIWLGSFDTFAEAIRSVNKGKAELAAKMKRAECDEFESPMKPTSVLGADNLNSCSVYESTYVVGNVDVSDRQEHNLIHSFSALVTEPENLNSADVDDRRVISLGNEQISACVSDFDEAMRLGIINEYGQLLGEYSELDKQMEFSMS